MYISTFTKTILLLERQPRSSP